MMKLETSRLILQYYQQRDAARIAQLANNKELAQVLGFPSPYEFKHAQEWIQMQPDLINRGIEYPLTIWTKDHPELIGTITIRIDRKNHKGEIGYWLGREYWSKGYATEAVKEIMKFGFNEIMLNKVWASTLAKNIGSINVLLKVGMKKEGTLKQNRLLMGIYEDVDVFGLVRDEYEVK